MRFPLLIFTLVATALAQKGNFPKLFCNRLEGNFVTCCDLVDVELGRPLEPGDKIIINGNVNSTYYMNRINFRDHAGRYLFHSRTAIYSDSPPRWDRVLYTTNTGGGYSEYLFGPNQYVNGRPIHLTITYTGTAYILHLDDILLMYFPIPYAPTFPIEFLELNGGWTTNWIQQDCARPSTTTAPTTTKRHRPPHRSSESDSGSQEFCE